MSSRPAIAAVLLVAACGGGGGGGSSEGYALTSIESVSYTANVTIGSQPFDVIVDTGSTTLAIAGSTCGNCNVMPEYTPGSGASDQHTTSSAVYGDSSMWMAENFSDAVEITGDTSVSMRFASITSQSGFFRQGFSNQGILGFGGQTIASPGTDSYIAQRMKAGLDDNFAFQLCSDSGTLWFGAPDASAEAGAEQRTPMVAITSTQPYYELSINSVALGSASINLSGDAVMDTGTSIMVMSSSSTNALISAITSSPGYAAAFGTQTLSGNASNIDCLTSTMTADEIDAALPQFSITLPDTNNGSFTLTVPATQSYFIPISGQFCFGVASVDGLPTILGDAFLRAFVTQFDLDNKQFVLAPQKGCAAPSVVRDRTGHAPWRIRGVPAT
jgi:Eukaryotic aspartyl protease